MEASFTGERNIDMHFSPLANCVISFKNFPFSIFHFQFPVVPEEYPTYSIPPSSGRLPRGLKIHPHLYRYERHDPALPDTASIPVIARACPLGGFSPIGHIPGDQPGRRAGASPIQYAALVERGGILRQAQDRSNPTGKMSSLPGQPGHAPQDWRHR